MSNMKIKCKSCDSNIIFKKDSKFIDETTINNNEKKGIYGDIYKYEQDGVKNKILNNENNLEGVDIYLRTSQIVIAVSHKKEVKYPDNELSCKKCFSTQNKCMLCDEYVLTSELYDGTNNIICRSCYDKEKNIDPSTDKLKYKFDENEIIWKLDRIKCLKCNNFKNEHDIQHAIKLGKGKMYGDLLYDVYSLTGDMYICRECYFDKYLLIQLNELYAHKIEYYGLEFKFELENNYLCFRVSCECENGCGHKTEWYDVKEYIGTSNLLKIYLKQERCEFDEIKFYSKFCDPSSELYWHKYNDSVGIWELNYIAFKCNKCNVIVSHNLEYNNLDRFLIFFEENKIKNCKDCPPNDTKDLKFKYIKDIGYIIEKARYTNDKGHHIWKNVYDGKYFRNRLGGRVNIDFNYKCSCVKCQ